MGAGCTTSQSKTITLSTAPPTKAIIKESKAQVVEQDTIAPQAAKMPS